MVLQDFLKFYLPKNVQADFLFLFSQFQSSKISTIYNDIKSRRRKSFECVGAILRNNLKKKKSFEIDKLFLV